MGKQNGGSQVDGVTRLAQEAGGAKGTAQIGRELFQALVETVNDWLWEVDHTGRYTYASPQVYDLLGYRPEEVVGKTPFDFMPAYEHERVARMFAGYMRKGQPFNALENINCRKDGHLIVLETSGVPFFGEAGELRGYRGVDRDITERKEMERERGQLIENDRRRLAMIEAIFDATQDGIAIYDADGKILRMNAAGEEWLGSPAETREADIDGLWERLHVEKLDGTPLAPSEIPVKRALAGEKFQTILRFRPSGQAPHWFSISATPIHSTEPTAARAVIILTDITELCRLKNEQEIFTQMVSHDLRTPITVIRGHTEMLQERLADGDELTTLNLGSIQGAIRLLTGMIEDLEQLIQLGKSEIPLNFEPIDVPEFIGSLVNQLTAAGIGWSITTAFPSNLPRQWVDAKSLERILTNLITNAFKHASSTKPVRVAAEVVETEMWISITDFGEGVPPEDQPYLFERFFRSKNARHKQGVGLGLYITRRLVEAHGGRIWVESKAGQGSAFTFSIPLRSK